MDESTERDLLASCPRCRYSLRGLPVEHRCPECGLPVDRRWEVFGGRPVWGTSYRAVWIFPFVLMGGALVWLVFYIGTQRPLGDELAIPTLSLTIAIFVTAVAWLFGRPPGFVAVGPNGVAVCRGRGRLDHYAWNRVGQGHVRRSHKTFDITIDGRLVLFPSFPIFRGNASEAERCVRFINAYLRDGGT